MADITLLNVFDLFRFMIGAITAEMIFVTGSVPRRGNWRSRAILGAVLCSVYCLSYFPCMQLVLIIPGSVIGSLISCLWWFLASLMSLAFLYLIYDITVSNLLFRGCMGLALQEVITVLLQYCIGKLWFPGFAHNRTALYVMVTIGLYAAAELLAYYMVARRMRDSGRPVITDHRRNRWTFLIILGVLSLCTNFSSGIMEWSIGIEGAALGDMTLFTETIVPWYCVFILLVVCIIIVLNQYSMYMNMQQRQENEFLRQMEKEKAQQYEFARENIDLINQKCHDLKYQLGALRLAEGKDRDRVFDETWRAVQFYDAAVRTDNPVLDTILTEKSLMCSKYQIRLSCNVRTTHLDRIEVVDLYTMLGNALDNAIECVRQYEDTDKRVISLSIRESGEMLHLFVDNYYEGELEIRNGFPVTSKEDAEYHGFGVKSINMLACKYGGDSMVSVQNKTFSLHVMIPCTEE